METILADAVRLKKERGRHAKLPLAGQTWAMLLLQVLHAHPRLLRGRHPRVGRAGDLPARPAKSSLAAASRSRTPRACWAGWSTAPSSAPSPRATWRSSPTTPRIPTINALTDHEHPCQILADIFTFQEKRGSIQGKVVAFIGDGAGNVATSWIFAAAKAGFELRIAAPKAFQPPADLLKRAGGKIVLTEDVKAAAAGADVLYTDVWVSMGREKESADRIRQMSGYQINAAVVALARPGRAGDALPARLPRQGD